MAFAAQVHFPFAKQQERSMKLIANPKRSKNAVLALKALLLVALVWGLIYPGLLWSLGHLVPA
jgi:hypothetical protein